MQLDEMSLSDTNFGDKNWCTNYCNEIQDQKDCASGWAFSAIGAVETIYAINHGGNMTALSAQECVDCKANEDGCKSNRTAKNCLGYLQRHRIATNESYPYTGVVGQCNSRAKKSFVEVTNITTMHSRVEKDLIN